MTDTRTVIRIVAYGIPGPQGSKSFKGMRRGKPVLVESSKKVKPWREAVEDAARVVLYSLTREQRRAFPLDEPLAGRFIFTLPKPASAPKRIRTWPMKYPDTSKLLRSTEDALTKAGVWVDDARLVELDRLVKVYPNEDPEALDRPGVVIEIRRIADLTGDPS
jgi:crossover junction endodeoxyribonuclease RusA